MPDLLQIAVWTFAAILSACGAFILVAGVLLLADRIMIRLLRRY